MKTDKFKITSGLLVLGDPCYDTNPICKARRGSWKAYVVMTDKGSFWGFRVRRVVVHHEDFNPADPRLEVEEQGFSVDSGQAGVFDERFYGGEEFYERCCKATLTRRQYGFLRDGFVTSSGYGDGWYAAEIQKVSGEAVCVELKFIGCD